MGRDPIDWAHTQKAEHDRREKAAALAAAARELGVPVAGIAVGGGRRRDVRKRAGIATASEATWHLVHELLTASSPSDRHPTPARGVDADEPRSCGRCGATSTPAVPVRFYPAGWRCTPCSPAALAGHVIPSPRPGTTAADLRSRRRAHDVALTPSIVAAKARARTAEERGRVAEAAHAIFLRGAGERRA